MKIAELNASQAGFLLSLPQSAEEEKGIPVYLRNADGTFSFVEDFKLSAKSNRQFEKEAPAGLYRGGSIIKVVSGHGVLVVPDERYSLWKPFAGMARHSEGHDLRLTGARELMEEAFIYDLAKTTRFVPKGHADATLTCSLEFTVEKAVEIDELVVLGWGVNEANRAREAVLQWDITGIPGDFSVSLEEKWFKGGRNGISVYALNSAGELVGVFSGQQGFLEFPEYGIHETLKKYL